MNQVSYNAKELLAALIEVEAKLIEVNRKNYQKREFLLSEDTDKVLEEFLQYQSVEDDNAGYISTELALFYLSKELEKTIDVVVIANDLRAYYDYNKVNKNESQPQIKKSWRYRDVCIGLTIGVILSSLFFFLW